MLLLSCHLAIINMIIHSAEYGRHLSELTVDVQCALPMRQLASVMLRQYVDTHWTPASDKFQPPEPCEATKAFIRQVR